MGLFSHIFKRNPFHDEKGRFASKDSRASASMPVDLGAHYDRYDQKGVTPSDILKDFTAIERGEIALARMKAEATPTSKKLYTDKDGNYKPARRKLHDQIVADILSEANIQRATPLPGHKPTLVVLGGRGGSGKSSFTNGKLNEFDAKKFLVLDTDAIKEKLIPPYKGWNAHSVHEESGDIFDAVMGFAQAQGLNIVNDSTLKSNSIERTVTEFKKAGYDIEGHYMFVPRQLSAKRAVQRYLGKPGKGRGRLVPVDVILQNTQNERNFDSLKTHFTKWSAYDNQGDAPKLIGRSKQK